MLTTFSETLESLAV